MWSHPQPCTGHLPSLGLVAKQACLVAIAAWYCGKLLSGGGKRCRTRPSLASKF